MLARVGCRLPGVLGNCLDPWPGYSRLSRPGAALPRSHFSTSQGAVDAERTLVKAEVQLP